MKQFWYSIILITSAAVSFISLSGYSQPVNDPFRQECLVNSALPTHSSGNVPFLNYIHQANQVSKYTVKYAFDGRPNSASNSLMDIYLRPAPLFNSGSQIKRPVVFILHGGDGNRLDNGLVGQANRYARRGYIAIVPDYRAGRDAIYSDALCRDSMQVALANQHSVVDVRGAIRKFISLVRDDNQLAAVADTSHIFIFGFSWGAGTAYSLAVSNSDEWKLNGTAVTGVQYFSATANEVVSTLDFYNDLDDLPVNGSCLTLDKSLIKGVSCTAMPTLNIGMVDENDTIPIMFYHGTCDPLAPFYKVQSRQLLINTISSTLASEGLPIPPISNTTIFPCYEPEFDYTFYGSQAVLDYIRDEVEPIGSIPFMTRIFRVCGGQHGIESDMVDFERTIFFKDILDGNTERSEEITLDYTLTLPPNLNPVGTKEYYNCFYQALLNLWPQNNQFCKTCSGYPAKLNAKSRCPYYDPGQPIDGSERYKAKPSSYCSNLGSQSQAASFLEIDYIEGPQTIEVFDLSGRLIRIGTIQGIREEAEMRFMQQSGLQSGIYVVRCAGISRKVGLFL